jgi:hypothetical protein
VPAFPSLSNANDKLETSIIFSLLLLCSSCDVLTASSPRGARNDASSVEADTSLFDATKKRLRKGSSTADRKDFLFVVFKSLSDRSIFLESKHTRTVNQACERIVPKVHVAIK